MTQALAVGLQAVTSPHLLWKIQLWMIQKGKARTFPVLPTVLHIWHIYPQRHPQCLRLC